MTQTNRLRDRRNNPFFTVEHRLLTEYGPIIGAYGIAVYNVLAHHANREEQAWPSYTSIAAMTGMSRRQAINSVAQLVDLGLITKHARKTTTGNATSNCYTLVDVPSGSAQPAPGVVHSLHQGSAQPAPEQEPINKNQVEQRHSELKLPSPNELMKKTSGEVSRQRAQAKMPHLYSGIDPRLLTKLTNEVKRIRGMASLIEKPGRDELEDELRKLAYDLHDAGYTTPESLQTLHAEWKQHAQNFSNPTPYAKQLYEFAVQTTGASPNGANETITVTRLEGDLYQ